MKRSIAFVTGGLSFTGNTIHEKSLGGSETALVHMALEFRRRGWDVRVFCECEKPGIYDGVNYSHHKDYPQASYTLCFDVVVVSRFLEFMALPNESSLRVLWIHDTLVDDNKKSAQKLMGCVWQTDLIIPLSEFHIKNYASQLEELKAIMWQSSNGVDLDLIRQNLRPKVKGKVIYTSRPERGLNHLLVDILPRIVQERPEVKLYFCNYDISGLAHIPEHVKQIIHACNVIAKKYPNHIIPLGNLTKSELYREISSAELYLFPTAFSEISCIGAMEAQACGTPVITTKDFALTETVGNDSGLLIPGLPPSPGYLNTFTSMAIRLLEDDERREEMSAAGPKFIQEKGYVWSQVAEKWEKKFLEMLDERWKNNKQRIIKKLEHQGDLVPAKFYSEQEFQHEYSQNLDKKIEQCIASSNLPLPNDEIPEAYIEALERLNRLVNMLKAVNHKPTKILDYACGNVSFALMAKKLFPDAEVYACDKDPYVCESILYFATQSKLDIKIIQAEDLRSFWDQGFDFVFLGNYIHNTINPADTIRSAMQCLSLTGFLGYTMPVGSEDARILPTSEKLWNLTFNDFRDMFSKSLNFQSSFIDGKISSAGEMQGTWVCVVQKSNVGDIDLERRKQTRPYESIACCMIVKDEEDNLRRCLKSVVPFVDKLIIADSGSQDRTLEIAQEFGAEIRQIEFDNFGQARNESVKDVTEDWIIWVDADEVLVGGEKIKRYLQSALYTGFVLKQHHMMPDHEKNSHDTPIRIYRNLPIYRFTGKIHEHCERIDRQPFDDPIHPSLVMPDVYLAHYGYTTEKMRRQKCSNRNMKMLIRDTTESPERKLSWLLVMRDYLNIAKWSSEKTEGRILPNTKEHTLLSACIATYWIKFSETGSRYSELAHPMYQACLCALGQNNLTFEDCQIPPFEIAFSLTGAIGGGLTQKVDPQTRWFLNIEEFHSFMVEKGISLSSQLIGKNGVDFKPYKHIPKVNYDAAKLLALGMNIQPRD